MVNDLTANTLANVSNVLKSMDEINKALEGMASTIQEANAGSAEVARSTTAATDSAVGISDESRKLAESAEILTQLVTRFKL
ncbi:MAG: hypothetical protein H5T98_03530 [Syntrophomonadaceae bacterium]|nr:hypothetical protein [Syntrophomonadaceae bacterium]